MSDIKLRPITAQDSEFLAHVYASTRAEEVAQTGWPLQQQQTFLQMQFDAQHQHYQQHYPEASFDLILLDETPVGRLYVSRWPTQIRIVDIALLTEYRGHSIGTQLLERLFEEAKQNRLEVSIHVEQNNPAMDWYLKLGFKKLEDKGVYCLMKTHFFSDNDSEKIVPLSMTE